MLDLKNFSINNQVSLNSLLTTRKELSKKRHSLINECIKYQTWYDKSYLKNPEYVKLQDTLNKDIEIITDISNCIGLYLKYGNISNNSVLDDRPVINNIISFDKKNKSSFNPKKHKLGVIVVWNTITKTSEFQGVNEEVSEDFFIIDAKNHLEVEKRFKIASHALYVYSDYFSINDHLRKGNKVFYGYKNEEGVFFETGFIS